MPKTKQKKKQPRTVAKSTPTPSNSQKGSVGRSLLTGAGKFLGNLVGFPSLGRDAGDFVADITGMGDYKVNNNTLGLSPSDIPVFNRSSDGSITVSHSEMIRDIKSSTTNFVNGAFCINPGEYQSFPWLSAIAQSFEQFEFQGLIYAFRSTCGSAIASTNNSLGTVIMATEYDMSRPMFTDKQTMEDYEFSNSFPPNVSAIHPVECNPNSDALNLRYVGSGARVQAAMDNTSTTAGAPLPTDVSLVQNLQNLGRFQIATIGMQASNITIGELWVSYKVRLLKPRLFTLGQRSGVFHSQSGPLGTNACTSGVGPFQVNRVTPDSTLGLSTCGITDSGTFRTTGLKPGTNLVVVLTLVSSAVITPGAITIGGSLGAAGYSFFNSTMSGTVSNSSANATTTIQVFSFTCDSTSFTTDGSVFFAAATTAGSVAYDYDLRVTIIPGLGLSPGYLGSSLEEEFSKLSLRLEKTEALLDRLSRPEEKEFVCVSSNTPLGGVGLFSRR